MAFARRSGRGTLSFAQRCLRVVLETLVCAELPLHSMSSLLYARTSTTHQCGEMTGDRAPSRILTELLRSPAITSIVEPARAAGGARVQLLSPCAAISFSSRRAARIDAAGPEADKLARRSV